MPAALTAHHERELAWLRIVQAHAVRLGLYATAETVHGMRLAAQARWARDVFRFA